MSTSETRPETVLNAVRRAWNREPRLHRRMAHPHMVFAGGALTLEGEVPDIATKKLALELAAAVPEIKGIVDRLHVTPAERLDDGEVRDLVRRALEQEPAFGELALSETVKGEEKTVCEPVGRRRGWIRLSVAGGVVTLAGLVPTESEREMAEFDAWYVFGVDRVHNRIEVSASAKSRG